VKLPWQLVEGDCMRLRGLQSKSELNMHIVQLVKKLDNGRWKVNLFTEVGVKTMSVAPENLGHIRPAK
jgi:hypothetical protein